ncbi:nicotinamide mononucleotide transporter [Planomicrobium stackebrandtii]|uniref:Nicotinamide mononucleotide transporter n=1 Tax=Planomicrobium stackebrandtii TaxID=253160 RepID=A0ABU0GRB7_9BACL|nr:nicotinamide riboside transporter PnuC [Planomicrobium stackebrandtii]MDQ0427494.1 nicotinamide mononucleotide transporter [Planomicrobium stackebrandtii]
MTITAAESKSQRFLKDWSLFEKSWLVIFTAINIYLFFAWDDTLLGLISSLSGMLCVLLVAKGKISNYYFGIIQTSTYAYISFTYGLYGEAMLNGLFYFPIQFIGLYLWHRNTIKNKNSVQGEDIIVKTMNPSSWLYTAIAIIIGTILYAILLEAIGGRSVGLDSATNVLSVTAQILMLKRFAEQWLVWILVNILSIVLWVVTLDATGGNDYTLVVMWTAFLVNSIYGYYNWRKMAKNQVLKEETV